MALFREDLSEEEVVEMKKWSREHPEYLDSYQEKIGVWHPFIIAEYNLMAIEKHNLRSLNHHL